VAVETVFLDTIDGISIEADIVRMDSHLVPATVVIAHPHPLYGGARFNPVVRAIQEASIDAGCSSIAIDFRGVGNSGGMHDNGDAEVLDLAAACELALDIHPDSPIVMAGYSFGAVVALNVSHPYISGWLAIAPPVQMMNTPPVASRSHHPKSLVMPSRDQFTSVEAIQSAVETWANTSLTIADNTDHYFAHGAHKFVAPALASIVAQL
jgi:hypothetical protein